MWRSGSQSTTVAITTVGTATTMQQPMAGEGFVEGETLLLRASPHLLFKEGLELRVLPMEFSKHDIQL